MEMEDIQNSFDYLYKWLKEKYKLAEPTLSQVTASLVQSHVIANGVPVKVKTGAPLEVGFISSQADGELHGSLDLNLSFNHPLTVESES
ncbi:hypothetical protein NDA01_22595 [Trichocoleus desertorum AS-A10]|uniref:hypothetical protein n=1 Tax=Trichocoleus desertorum TaxID=1481672 RepID=UPI0032971695